MTFEDIIGNEDAVKALEGMAASGRIPHAMMFYENDGCGAIPLVLALLDAVFAHDRKVARLIHPDIHWVYPVASGTKVDVKTEDLRADLFLGYWRELVTKNPYALESEVVAAFGIGGKVAIINAAEAKEILDTVYLTSVEGGCKAVVVYLPEKMNATAANRLLKAIEEPPAETLFLMVTHSPDKVMPTISSRCQTVRVLPVSREEIVQALCTEFGFSAEEAAAASLDADGSIGKAMYSLSDPESSRELGKLFRNLMDALVARNLSAALQCGEAVAALPSRENQKLFCKFATDCLRKVFLLQQNLPQLAGIPTGDLAYFQALAQGCRKNFPRAAMAVFNRASLLVDRSVNQKIVFCDAVGKMYLSM